MHADHGEPGDVTGCLGAYWMRTSKRVAYTLCSIGLVTDSKKPSNPFAALASLKESLPPGEAKVAKKTAFLRVVLLLCHRCLLQAGPENWDESGITWTHVKS